MKSIHTVRDQVKEYLQREVVGRNHASDTDVERILGIVEFYRLRRINKRGLMAMYEKLRSALKDGLTQLEQFEKELEEEELETPLHEIYG